MKLYDMARGTVTVEISGAEPERILNALAQRDIAFWDTTPKKDFKIKTTLAANDYPTLCALNGKSGCEVRLLSSFGGKSLSRNLKRRAALFAALTVCAVILAVSSLFVWNISITGNERLTEGEILRTLSAAGLEKGSCILGLDTESIKNRIMLQRSDISWIAVNVSGSRAEIVIHERKSKPEIVKESSPQSIYASKSGVITKLGVLSGSAAVAVGDTVAEGDLLVSGVVLSETAEARYVHSLAVVEARTWYELSAVTPLYEYAKTEIYDENTELSLFIGKKRINFCSDSRNSDASCDKINKIMQPSFGSHISLPFGIEKSISMVYDTEYRQIDIAAAVSRMERDLEAELRSRIGDGEIVSMSCTVSCGDELLYVTLRAECIENIAISGEI